MPQPPHPHPVTLYLHGCFGGDRLSRHGRKLTVCVCECLWVRVCVRACVCVCVRALVWPRSVNETKGINSSRISDTTAKFTDTQPYCYLYAARLVYDSPLVGCLASRPWQNVPMHFTQLLMLLRLQLLLQHSPFHLVHREQSSHCIAARAAFNDRRDLQLRPLVNTTPAGLASFAVDSLGGSPHGRRFCTVIIIATTDRRMACSFARTSRILSGIPTENEPRLSFD
jgi:hypothetical protein